MHVCRLRDLLAKKIPQTETPSTGMQNNKGSNVTGTGGRAGCGVDEVGTKNVSDDDNEGESGNESYRTTKSKNNDNDEVGLI